MSFIKINGRAYPAPNLGLGCSVTTTVNSVRNEHNVVIGQRIGKDLHKIENCQWTTMDASTWSALLMEFDKNFYATIEYPDMVHNTWQSRIMYPGDRSAEPSILDAKGLPIQYKNCKCDLIDTGR